MRSIRQTFSTVYCRMLSSAVLLAVLVVGCGESETVVARIDQVELTLNDYERFVGNLSPVRDNLDKSPQARLGYLQAMVDQQLLLIEGRARGLFDDPQLNENIEMMTRRHLSELYGTRQITPRVEVQQTDLEREFAESQLDRQRLLSRILVRTAEERDRVLAALADGEAFASVLDPFATNDAIAEGDGVVGWFNGAEAERRFQIPQRAFFSLEQNSIAAPVRLSRGWQIYRFIDERTAELDSYYQEVRRRVRDRKWKAETRQEIERLKREYQVQVSEDGVARLQEFMSTRTTRKAEAPQVDLYTFKQGGLDVPSAVNYLRVQGIAGSLPSGSAALGVIEEVLLKPLLFEKAARELGWDRESEVVAWVEREREKQVLTVLMARETSEKIQLTESEVTAFYEANSERFVVPQQVVIRQLATSSQEAAAGFRSQLEAGADIGRLLIRRDAETYGKPRTGELTLTPILASRYPRLLQAAFDAPDGVWVGPVEMEDGHFTVFQVINRRAQQMEAFDSAKPRVEALMRQQRESELAGRFIRQIRTKYADQVVLFKDRLLADKES